MIKTKNKDFTDSSFELKTAAPETPPRCRLYLLIITVESITKILNLGIERTKQLDVPWARLLIWLYTLPLPSFTLEPVAKID